MGPAVRLAKTAIALLGVGFLSATAQARMVEMADSELSDVTGQAFINLTTDSANGLDFTRINFGLDMATQLNINKLQLGLYPRSDEVANSADIDINNFGLGTVNDVTGQVSPFVIKNPFLELAYQGNKVVGVRLGFGEAQGYMSGDINRITGNIAVDLYGKGRELAPKMTCSGWDYLACVAAKGAVGSIYADRDFSAQAQLVNGGGDPDPVRATMIGMVDGQGLSIPSGNWFDAVLLGLFKSNNCSLVGTNTCFPLTNYGSFPIGQVNTSTQQFTSAAQGVFLSMQSQNVQWRDQQDASKFITALAGAFMNIPRNADGSAAINTSFQEAFEGIPRQDTCLGGADRGC